MQTADLQLLLQNYKFLEDFIAYRLKYEFDFVL
jgi:hypothetical protein